MEKDKTHGAHGFNPICVLQIKYWEYRKQIGGQAHSNLPVLPVWLKAPCILPPRWLQPTNSLVPEWQLPSSRREMTQICLLSPPLLPHLWLGHRPRCSHKSHYHCSYSYYAGCTGLAAILLLPSIFHCVPLLHSTDNYTCSKATIVRMHIWLMVRSISH